MNKIYRIIWSDVRHCYIAVSELVNRRSKTKSVHQGGGLLAEKTVHLPMPSGTAEK